MRICQTGCIICALGVAHSVDVLRQVGRTVKLKSPNNWKLFGIGGLLYTASTDTWTAVSEGNPGAGDGQHFSTLKPRLYEFRAHFDTGELSGVEDGLGVDPPSGLKAEGIAFVGLDKQLWLVSESNSNTQETSSFWTRKYGHPDLNTFDPDTLVDSRVIRLASNGSILEEILLPSFMLWDGHFDWDPNKCHGNRPLKGLHSIARTLDETSTPNTRGSTVVMATQASLYQDGGVPTDFAGSRVRLLFWQVTEPHSSLAPTLQYSHSHRYDVGHRVLDTFQKGARHVRGMFAMLALNAEGTELLIGETELLESFSEDKWQSEIYYVVLNRSTTVDHCYRLTECDVAPPLKRKIFSTTLSYELSAIAWGPIHTDETGVTSPTIAITFENDNHIGLHMELYRINISLLQIGELFKPKDSKDNFLKLRIVTVSCGLVVVALLFISQAVLARILTRSNVPTCSTQTVCRGSKWEYRHYIVGSCIANSVLLGGLTFGFPSLALILRKERVFSESCACGIFCSGQQERLSILSTFGFVAAIGSRLFIGNLLDRTGPRLVSSLCCVSCFAAFIAFAVVDDMERAVTACWIILAGAGSGLHLTGFHTTNLFEGKRRKAASAALSAGFGASSLILPVLQSLHQFADVSWKGISVFYSIICLLLFLNNLLIQPQCSWRKPGSTPHKFWRHSSNGIIVLDCKSCNSHATCKDTLQATSKRNSLHLDSELREILCSASFWGEAFFFSINLFAITFYLSTVGAILFALGDQKISDQPNDISDYVYTRIAGFINGIGFLWFPAVSALSQNLSFAKLFACIVIANILLISLLTLPVLETQVLTFAVQAGARLMLFSVHFGYIGQRFGFKHFGILNGISSLLAAVLGLSNYPLQLFSVYVAEGNFTIALSFIGGGVVLSAAFPLSLAMQNRRAAAKKMLKPASDKLKCQSEKTVSSTACVSEDVIVPELLVPVVPEAREVFFTASSGATKRHGAMEQCDAVSGLERSKELSTLKRRQSKEFLRTHFVRQEACLNDPALIFNWAQTVSYASDKLVFPGTEQEVQMIVMANHNVRVAGALHSSSPLSASSGVILSTKRLNRVVSIDKEHKLITCEAGCVVGFLMDALLKEGLALSQWGTIDHQTIVGALMTGTHGGSAMHNCTCSMVRGCRMVLADGSLREIGEGDPLLEWIFPSIGMLGIVTQVTLAVEPHFWLHARCRVVSAADFMADISTIVRSSEYTRFVLYPACEEFTVWTADRVAEPESSHGEATVVSDYMAYESLEEQNVIADLMQKKLDLLCDSSPLSMAEFRQLERNSMGASIRRIAERLRSYIGSYHHVFLLSRNNEMPHADMELMFRLEHAPGVIAEVLKVAAEHSVPYYNVECRVVKADSRPLSQFNINKGQADSCKGSEEDCFFCIDFQAYSEDAYEYFKRMEERLQKFNYRVHWAKGVADTESAYLRAQFPVETWQTLRKLREELDPSKMFDNPHMARWFGEV
mmetsp:Transcript_60775/g.100949  ORF Transcript_60775/g.100949 Transcript_60775/m.100949 type:complete len:1477 (-) Transcript_60775:181-4611(-)